MTKHRIERIEWREVVWQRPFSEDNVIEMLTHLATLENRGAIVWESRSRKGYVKHIIGAESRNMNKIAEAIKIHGDIAIYTLPAQTRQLVRTARKLVISKPSLALNTGVMLSTIRAGLAALANVRGDDCAVLQIVLGGSYAPTMVPKSFPDPHASWLQAIFGSTEQITNEARKSVREKSEQHCFQALIRIGASGEYARASINGVLSALRTLESAGVRIYTDSEKAQNINIAHVPWHFPMRLSVKEAASFLMLPIGEDELPGTLGLHPKSVSPPLWYRDPINRMNDRTFALSQDGVNSKKLSISPKDGLEHTILLGPTGSGKSTAMQNLILSDIYAGRSVLVIDPKADLVNSILERLPESRYDDVVVIDPSDPCPVEKTHVHTSRMEAREMLSNKFGVEIEFTGITRNRASTIVAKVVNGTTEHLSDGYDTYQIKAADGRKWKVMSDSSIECMHLSNGRRSSASSLHAVELVTPILTYREDIDTLQNMVRLLRKGGGFTNSTCGIHIHLDGAPHTPRSIVNFINLVASRNDLFYKALQIKPGRARYCKKMDEYLVEQINQKKPKTMAEIEDIWYSGYSESRWHHYHDSRYHFLNLHSFFNGNHTVELRGFNSDLHAGKVRAYIVFALALDHQALSQKCARYKKVQEENEKFAMRVYLNRIGFIGEEFKSCRAHLYEHLSGNAAWRYGSKENCRSHRPKNEGGTEDA